jgi:hypothetical protein
VAARFAGSHMISPPVDRLHLPQRPRMCCRAAPNMRSDDVDGAAGPGPIGTSACARLVVLADDRRAERGDAVECESDRPVPGHNHRSVRVGADRAAAHIAPPRAGEVGRRTGDSAHSRGRGRFSAQREHRAQSALLGHAAPSRTEWPDGASDRRGARYRRSRGVVRLAACMRPRIPGGRRRRSPRKRQARFGGYALWGREQACHRP